MNYVRHLNYRLYANTVLDNRFSEIQRIVKFNPEKFIKENREFEIVNINGQDVRFDYYLDIQMIDGMVDGFELTLDVIWHEGDREVTISRSGYISQFLDTVIN